MDTCRGDADAMAGGQDEAPGQTPAVAEVSAVGWDDVLGPDLAEAVGELTGVWQGRLHLT